MDLDALLAEAEAYRARFDTVPETSSVPQDTIMVSMPTIGEAKPKGRPAFDDPCNPKQTLHFINKCKFHYIPSPLGGWARVTRLECRRLFNERLPEVVYDATIVEDRIYIR